MQHHHSEETSCASVTCERIEFTKDEQMDCPNNDQTPMSNFTENAVAFIREATNPEISHFQSWDSESLRDILVQNDIQIRGASFAPHEYLVRICDEVFQGQDPGGLVQQPRRFSIEELTQMDASVRMIQKAFLQKKFSQNKINSSQYMDAESCGRMGLPGDAGEDSDCHTPDLSENELGDELDAEWTKPSWKFAKQFEAMNRPHRAGESMKQYDWRRITLGRHCMFGGFGEQLDLWNEGKTSELAQFGSGITNYFKFVKWCCWVMLILSILHVPVIIINMFGGSVQYDSVTPAVVTFGNLGRSDLVTSIQIPGCNEAEFQQESCTIDKDALAVLYATIDAVGVVIVIIAYVWLRSFEKAEAKNLNRSTVSASDYTLRVTNIPGDATETQLAAHFAMLTGEAVSEVNLAFENSDEVHLYFKRGRLSKKRFDCIQRIRYQKTMQKRYGNEALDSRQLKRLLKEREKLTLRIKETDAFRKSTVDPCPRAIQAFVTFETEHGFVKAVSTYQLSWVRSLFYPKRLRFKGKRLGRVYQSPEPSTIMWENLEYSFKNRFLRKCATTGVATLAILLSITFTFLARDFQQKALESMESECPGGFSNLAEAEQLSVIEYDIELAHCYCSSLSRLEQSNEDVCRDYLTSKLKSAAMSYGAAAMVCAMNSFFTWLMGKAGSFEKHHSLDSMEESIMTRTFLLKFINTGCLILLYNQKWLQNLVNVKIETEIDFGVKWYETGGVSLIIVMCMNTVVPHLGILYQYISYKKRLYRLESKLTDEQETDDSIKVWYTQDDLNKVYLGPKFQLNYRYAQILVTFFICYMYAISMPLMPFLGAISFYISFWVDKFLFCNYYRVPLMYSDKMGRSCTKFIRYAIVLHLSMSMWMMGNRAIFSSSAINSTTNYDHLKDVSVNENLRQDHIIILEVLLITYVLLTISRKIIAVWGKQMLQIFRCIICSKGNKEKVLKSMMNTVQVNYSSARDRKIIKGLASYNMLQNPKYKEAFAISDEFALKHSRVSNIRGYNTKEGSLCDKRAFGQYKQEINSDLDDLKIRL